MGFPEPKRPSAMTFSGRSIHSRLASASTIILFNEGMASKLKLSRFLTDGNFAALYLALDHAPLPVDQFQLGQPGQIVHMDYDHHGADIGLVVSFSFGAFSVVEGFAFRVRERDERGLEKDPLEGLVPAVRAPERVRVAGQKLSDFVVDPVADVSRGQSPGGQFFDKTRAVLRARHVH